MIAGNAFDNGDQIVLDAARSKELWRDNPNDFGDAKAASSSSTRATSRALRPCNSHNEFQAETAGLPALQYRRLQRPT